MKKLVIIGGGTGTFTVLSGLKHYPVDLTAIVTVADSGGSTGRLRDEFGYLPVGDFRMALVALASTDEDSEILRKLFLYRFDKGEPGLRGHNFGNLFIIAMADLLGSYEAALERVSKLLNISGKIIPVASQPLDLLAQYQDGSIVSGESLIDEPVQSHDFSQRIVNLWLEPEVTASKEAIGAILEADFIILGPGDLYTSLLANIVVSGISSALCKTNARIIYNMNLMTKNGQTNGYKASDYVKELFKYVNRYPDLVTINTETLPEDILKRYSEQQDYPVEDDLVDNNDYAVIRGPLLASEEYKKSKGDSIKRSLIRHDPAKLAWMLIKVVNQVMD